MIISCSNIKKSFNDKLVLNGISFHIEEQEKVALIGNNGAGKTTLFRILNGSIPYDEGSVMYSKDCSIGYLKQHMELDSNYTVYEELLHVFDEVLEIEKQLTLLENKIAQTSSLDLVNQYDKLRLTYESKRGYEYKSLIKGVLTGLGFSHDIYDQPIRILSGGQKNRVALAKLLLLQPTLLLLDEPTNHLDIEAIEWLEGFLKSYKGAVIVISHDRYFLDKVVTKVIHIEFGKCSVYSGNYSDFTIKSAKEYEVAKHHYEKQQREIARQQAIIAKLKQFNREKSIRRARSREKMLSKIEVVDMPMIDDSTMQLSLKPQITSGNDVLIVEDVSKSFDDKELFKNIRFTVNREDKIALVGPNGVGKTTLFRIILGMVNATQGHIKLGSNVVIGYYDQEHMNLDLSRTIMEEIRHDFPDLKDGTIRNVLAAFLFYGDDVFKPISMLSGGERGRVALAKIMLSKANFLILDEPTNHLDIMSKEILENALCNYEGTVLYISHDRYFINETATKVIEITPSKAIEYLGDYDYYLDKKNELKVKIQEEKNQNTSSVKEDWKKQKEEQMKARKLQNRITAIETQIEDLEQRCAEIDALLCQEEIYSNFEKSGGLIKEKEELQIQITELYNEWDTLTEKVL